MLKVVCLNLTNVKKSDLIEPTYYEGPFNDLGWDYLWLCEDKKIRPHRIEISKNFSNKTTTRQNPKWQLPISAISQTSTSQKFG